MPHGVHRRKRRLLVERKLKEPQWITQDIAERYLPNNIQLILLPVKEPSDLDRTCSIYDVALSSRG